MKKIISVVLIMFVAGIFIFAKNNDYYSIAVQRQQKYHPKRKDYVIIIDYTKNIFSNRLFILDMKTKQIILSSTVSHAYNSGFLKPTNYSNLNGSKKSSKGNYITMNTRYGKFGFSMVVKGLDYGINHNAQNRLIIFHSNKKMKFIWSSGCFATPENINEKIINLTKNGCLVCVID